MQEKFAQELRKAISHERLDAYRQKGGKLDDSNLFAHYAWNIALSERLYPALQGLEVTLRNSIHDAFSAKYETEEWYMRKGLLDAREWASLEKALNELRKCRKPREPGRVIAELNFGFWTSLFDSRYEQTFWHGLIQPVFPYLPKPMRRRKTLSNRLNRIRRLRNRVFHHEPIWYWSDLSQQHEQIHETIAWMNPSMARMIAAFDRFGGVSAEGVVPYEEILGNME